MGFKETADLDASTTISLGGEDRKTGKKNPTSIEGYYVGSRKIESAKSKSGFCSLHIFQTSKGNVGVWGKTNMDSKLLGVTPGVMTRVSFVGMVETKNNPMYKYKVELDADNTIDVSAVSNETATSDDSAAYDDTDTADYTDDSAPVDEAPAPRAQLPKTPAKAPSLASQQRVRELLAGAKRTA